MADNIPAESNPSSQKMMFLIAAGAVMVFVLVLVALISSGGSDNDDALKANEVRQIAQEVVGTRFAAMPTVITLNEEDVRDIAQEAASTQIAALPTVTTLEEDDVRSIVQEVVSAQIAALPANGGEPVVASSMSENDVRNIVREEVGTQIAALPTDMSVPVAADGLSEETVRDIAQEVVSTQIAALPTSSGSTVSDAQMQQIIDDTVNTKVAALIPTATPIPPTPTVIPRGVAEEDDPYRGPADAPVVIVEFSDFQCHYCGVWYQETLPQILEAYPTEVKFVYRDFPIFGDDSVRAAMASECAEDQGKFWEMHNRLFDHAVNQEQTALSQETLVGYAEDLGLDTRSFAECLSTEKYLEEIQADYQTAVNYGLRGTPGFVIDGVVYTIGAQPFSVFNEIIKGELAKSESSEG
jgi:protein-disulfide isomerase